MAHDPHEPLIPDPEKVRQRLADLAREQQALRKILRAIATAKPPASSINASFSIETNGGDADE